MSLGLNSDELKSPGFIVKLLESLNHVNIKTHHNYITCGRSEGSSSTGISVYLDGTKAIVTDYSKGIRGDLISYIQQTQNMTFRQALKHVSDIAGDQVGIETDRNRNFFDGFYNVPHFRSGFRQLSELSADVLDRYEPIGNARFLRDGITLSTQRYFDIGYFAEEQYITIPLYDENHRLVGIKARKDEDSPERKYIHLVTCPSSSLLYGFSQNYEYISNADELYVFEAEKSVMQAHSFGVRNCVSIGSSTISDRQRELMLYLNPKRIVLMFDEGLDEKTIEKNCKKVFDVASLKGIEVWYWQPPEGTESKISPTDRGKKRFVQAADSELVQYRG